MTTFILIPVPSVASRLPSRLKQLRKLGFKATVFGGRDLPRRDKRHLTPRQTLILRELASGLRTREIAVKLKLSIKTIETHRLNLMRRLGIRGIPRLVRYALRNGVLPASWLLE